MPSSKSGRASNEKKSSPAKAAARNTDSAPANLSLASEDRVSQQAAQTGDMAKAMPFNANKAAEHGFGAGLSAPQGIYVPAPSSLPGASTLSENNTSPKVGAAAAAGSHPMVGPLARVRVDGGGQRLTTNQGVPIADNQNSLKYGARGPVLLEDFVLRDKLTHFDHERIPERIVHARGSAAHGFFEAYEPLPDLTMAAPFSEAGKITPVFVRFSTVQGERGSKDTARDVRGFAVKFYTDEGNWDLVGNNIPVFFIQDAMKFPDLVHAVKPEPHHGMPQAASAHDTFWDFVSLMPESTHMLLWVMSDRAIPRSYATMQGFGVHSYRLVNEAGDAVFVKFHWNPKFGTHSLAWDEAVKISGADPDYHRRDLWERIESGAYPEWELGLQVFTEEQADKFSFDVLDATKIIPEELVPVRPVGRMVLNRNPDNFFAETEQVAFCTANVIRGIDFSNDPLLAGRIHSYVDTQISRLGGPNFHEIPINSPIAPVHNNQRDGMHRQAIHRGKVSYEPNSLGGGCPFQAGAAQGFTSVAARLRSREEQGKVRAKPELFAEHYHQATLFYNSQTPVEQAHIAAAFRFELSKVTVPAIRERVVSMLRNVSEDLAAIVADGINLSPLPPPMPKALERHIKPEVARSEALSLMARPGDGTVRGRKVAIMVADGCLGASVLDSHAKILAAGAVPRFVSTRIGPVQTEDGVAIEADASFENEPGFLFDGLVLADGAAALSTLSSDGNAMAAIRDQYRHCKTILAIGASGDLLDLAGVPTSLPSGEADPGLMRTAEAEAGIEWFIAGLARHRHSARETDPPLT